MANLVRWDPFNEFDRMDRSFNRMMRRAFSGSALATLRPLPMSGRTPL